MRLYWLDFQACPNRTGAILHDVKAHPRPGEGVSRNSDAIVDYTQLDSFGRTSHPYNNYARAGIFVRIDYGFACDPVEMQSHGRVLNGNFFVGLQPARHGPMRLLNQCRQRGDQTGRFDLHRMQAAGDRARFRHSVIDQVRDLFNVLHLDDWMLLEPEGDRASHERDGSKMLAQAVVQLLPEAALFAVTDGKDFAFQCSGAIFQDGLSFFSIADVENNRDGRLCFALGVAQWGSTDADPQSRPIFATITFFELVRLGCTDDSAKKSPAMCNLSGCV